MQTTHSCSLEQALDIPNRSLCSQQSDERSNKGQDALPLGAIEFRLFESPTFALDGLARGVKTTRTCARVTSMTGDPFGVAALEGQRAIVRANEEETAA